MLPYYLKHISPQQRVFYTWFSAMHTRIDMIIVGNYEEAWLCELSEKILHQIEETELVGNCFNPLSELSTLLQKDKNTAHSVSPLLYGMLQLCKHYHQLTEGLFDVSIDTENHDINSINHLHLNPDQTITITSPLRLNLSGFIKGYALDQVKQIFQNNSVHNALVSMGSSSIMAMGMKSVDVPWSIRISGDSPDPIELHDQFLTTSGNDHHERRHIINPITHNYIEGKKAISVITPTGTLGEVLSTTLFISPSEKLLSTFGSECQLLTNTTIPSYS